MRQVEGERSKEINGRFRWSGSGKVSVPYKCILIALLASVSSAICIEGDELVKQVRTPNRPFPAETILLNDGSTTFVSSLEDYLSRVTTSTTTTTTVSPGEIALTTNTSPEEIRQNDELQTLVNRTDNKMRFSSSNELEREEITTPPSSLIETTTKMINKPSSGGHEHIHHHEASDRHQHIRANSSASEKGKILQHYEVRGLLNVTNDYPLAYSRVICGYVWPLMAAITLFTNLMIVFVLTQNDMRTPTNVVLTAIAIADIIPIIVPVPWFVYLFAMGNEKQVLYPPIACYFYQHLTRSVSEVFYFLSTWLNVLLAVQDYLTACWPQLAKKYCQIKVVVIEVISLTILAFLLNLPQAIKLVFKPVKFFYNGQLTYGCKALQARWFKDLIGSEYAALYDDVFTAIIVVFVDGGPAIALVTLTWLLIRQLQRQRIQGHLLMEQARTASKRRRERHRQQEYEASARVMIFVLLAFLAVKMPFATTYTLMIIQSRFEIHFMESLNDFQKALTLIDLVFVLSYPLNFTIFCCCSKKFRHKCAELLGKCDSNTKKVKSRLMHSISGSLNSETLSIAHGRYKRDSVATTIDSRRDSVCLTANPNANGQAHELFASSQNLIKQQAHEHDKQSEGRRGQAEAAIRNYQLDKICDGRNHFDLANYRPPEGVLQADLESAEFRALLEDGSLCFECIMRYEQLRNKWLQSRIHSDQARRVSNDSSGSWPTCPPPPPPMHIAHLYQHLPQIVTTRCDSIRERPSSEIAEIGDCVVAHSAGATRRQPAPMKRDANARRSSSRRASSNSSSPRRHFDRAMGSKSSSSPKQQIGGADLRESNRSQAGSFSASSDCWRASEDDLTMQNLDLIWQPSISSGGSGTSHQGYHRADISGGSKDGGMHQVEEEREEDVLGGTEEEVGPDPRVSGTAMPGETANRRRARGHSLLGYSGDYPGDDTQDYLGSAGGRGRDSLERRSSDRPATKQEHLLLQEHHQQRDVRRSNNREATSSERLSSSQGNNESRAPSLSNQMYDKQRSMSMSNSKLTSLANATGLLAGIMKNTLLTADPKDDHQPSSSAGHLSQLPASATTIPTDRSHKQQRPPQSERGKW